MNPSPDTAIFHFIVSQKTYVTAKWDCIQLRLLIEAHTRINVMLVFIVVG